MARGQRDRCARYVLRAALFFSFHRPFPLHGTAIAGVTIGDGSTVGAGSVVTKNVEPFTVVAGNPAKLIRRLDRKELPKD